MYIQTCKSQRKRKCQKAHNFRASGTELVLDTMEWVWLLLSFISVFVTGFLILDEGYLIGPEVCLVLQLFKTVFVNCVLKTPYDLSVLKNLKKRRGIEVI